MRSRWALILSLCALPLWLGVLLLFGVRFAALQPTFYQLAVRQGTWLPPLRQALLRALPSRIPEASWSPWIDASPATLQAALDLLLSPATVEATLVESGPSWARWTLGEGPAPDSLVDALASNLPDSARELLRAGLWEALPTCAQLGDGYCLPQDPVAWPETSVRQRVWWEQFQVDAETWLSAEEQQFVDDWGGPPVWLRWLWYGVPALAFALSLAACFLGSGRDRWMGLGFPLWGAGMLGITLGILGWFQLLDAQLVSSVLNGSQALSPLSAALFDTLSFLLGQILVLAGAIAMAAGMGVAFFVVEGRRAKSLFLMAVLLTLISVGVLAPQTSFAAPAALAELEIAATPTPWPTLTSTPTITPTPYWPVLPGTPLPTPLADFSAAPALIGCVQAPGSAQALYATERALWVVLPQQIVGYQPQTLQAFAQQSAPITLSASSLLSAGRQMVLAGEQDLYLFDLPGLERSLQGRVSTLSPINALTSVAGRDYIALALEKGEIWVLKASSGGIVWILAGHSEAVSVLAAHPTQPLLLSGSADHSLRLWDLTSGTSELILKGHHAPLREAVISPSGERALSLDADGMLILWDLERRTVLRQLNMHAVSLTRLLWLDAFVVAGTARGDLLFLDEDLNIETVVLSDQAIVAMALSEETLFVGTADGRVCAWATMAPR